MRKINIHLQELEKDAREEDLHFALQVVPEARCELGEDAKRELHYLHV